MIVPTPTSPAPAAQAPQPQLPALALLAPPAGPSRLLQAPAEAPAAVPGRKLGLDTVDYDEHGAIKFSGTAPPDSPLRAYVDNGSVGDTKADPHGHWAMSPPEEVPPGLHQLRLDQLTAQGQVANRLELPFKREFSPRRKSPMDRSWCSRGRTFGGWPGAPMALGSATPSSSWPTGTRFATPG